MTYDKFIDSALEYEQYSNAPEPELTVEFSPEDAAAYQALLQLEGGYRSSLLQGQIKATQQTAEQGTGTAYTTSCP